MIGALCTLEIEGDPYDGICVAVRGRQLGLNIPTILPMDKFRNFPASEYNERQLEWTTVADYMIDNTLEDSTFIYCYRKHDWCPVNLYLNVDGERVSILEVDRNKLGSPTPSKGVYRPISDEDLDNYVMIGYCSASPMVFSESELKEELEETK